jgi:hypothetical protein
MSNQVKGGRKPIAQKATTANPYAGFFTRSLTDVPEDVKKAAEAKGHELRWIDKKEFVEAGNMHKNYWEPFRRDPAVAASHDTMDLAYGNSPDGYLVRKGMILASRPKQLGDAHREMIRERTERLHGAVDNDGLEED